MSRRRDDLKALFAGGDASPTEAAPETKALVPQHLRPKIRADDAMPPPPVPRSSSGALKAMGLELDGLKQAAVEADQLRDQLGSGETVVTLDPREIDIAFIRDRMATSIEADASLEASLAEHGQQVPVLVRPHPRKPGRYEAVYGHRRIAALARLGRKVKALVRKLSDDELVVSQGQENNARRDLSFIERARFTAALEERGFKRKIILAALDVHKADIVRYIGIVNTIDPAIIDRIGPAPKAGRATWQTLGDRLGGRPPPPAVQAFMESERFASLGSDARLKAVIALLSPRVKQTRAEVTDWQSADGTLRIALENRGETARFSLNGARSEDFAAFMQERLESLYSEFAALNKKKQ